MNISLKLLLYKQKTYSDGTNPVVLQYILNRKAKKKVLVRCMEADWDTKRGRVKSGAEGANNKNEYISEQYSKAEKLLYDIKRGERSADDIFTANDNMTLKQVFEAELVRLKKENKAGAYGKILVFQKQIDNLEIQLSHIDKKWFNKLIRQLTEINVKTQVKKNNPNTVKKKITTIKQIISRYDKSVISSDIKGINVPGAKTVKQKLTESELTALSRLQLPENYLLAATRDFFLLQVYLRGIRVGDLLQAYSEDFANGKFQYKADKTDKELNIKLIPAALSIIERYAGKHDRLFPFFTWSTDKKLSKFENERARLKHKEVCTTVINRYLKILAIMAGIKKPLSSHIARHTFARMAIDKINNPMVTMELLGHSSLAVHQQYLNDIRKEDVLDAAADDIFGSNE